MHTELQQVRRQNTNLQNRLEHFMQQPRVAAQDIVKQWHERANDIIEASHSREKSNKKFNCAHEDCNWIKKQVTLQAGICSAPGKETPGENSGYSRYGSSPGVV